MIVLPGSRDNRYVYPFLCRMYILDGSLSIGLGMYRTNVSGGRRAYSHASIT